MYWLRARIPPGMGQFGNISQPIMICGISSMSQSYSVSGSSDVTFRCQYCRHSFFTLVVLPHIVFMLCCAELHVSRCAQNWFFKQEQQKHDCCICSTTVFADLFSISSPLFFRTFSVNTIDGQISNQIFNANLMSFKKWFKSISQIWNPHFSSNLKSFTKINM